MGRYESLRLAADGASKGTKDAAAEKLAEKLAAKDFREQVMSLGQTRMINRAFMARAVGEFDPEYIDLPRLYQMRKDPMIQMGLHYRKWPLIRAKKQFHCEDPRIAAGVEEIVGNVWSSYTKTMCNKFDFGFQGGIKQFKRGKIDGKYEDENGNMKPIWPDDSVEPLLLDTPLPLPPDFIAPRLEDGVFMGIDAGLSSGSSKGKENDDDRFVPAEWAIWAVNEFEETFRNWYGYPLTGYAYRYWWSYWFRFHMEDRHFEMDADPALEIMYPPGDSPDGAGNMVSNKELALRMGNDLRGGATIAWPSDVHIDDTGKMTTTPKWSAKFLTGGENLQAFRESAEYLDVMKLRSMLMPEQTLVEGKGGTSSRNVASSYADIYLESLGQEGEDLAQDWNDHHIPQIVEANWGADAPRCTMEIVGFEEEDNALSEELVKIAFQTDPNALPMDFDQILKRLHMPILSAQEQKEREDQLAEEAEAKEAKAQEELAAKAEEEPPEGESEVPRGRGTAAFSFGGKFKADRPGPLLPGETPVVHLHQGAKPVDSTAPEWARLENDRRERNIQAVTERLQREAQTRYERIVESAARFVEDFLEKDKSKLSLAFRDRSRVKKFLRMWDGLERSVRSQVRETDESIRAEAASMFHTAGAAELIRLGQKLDNWNVEGQPIQEWAKKTLEDMMYDSDKHLLELHIKPWLEEQFEGPSYEYDPEPTLSLGQKLRVKFARHPEWMALRTARTEARHTYNNASLDVWELSGIKKVRAYDGLGGVTGKTDEVCLGRNGQIMTIEQARAEDAAEHPNGTLGFVPVIEETVIQLSQIPPDPNAVRSDIPCVIDSDGQILSDEQVGKALVGAGDALQ